MYLAGPNIGPFRATFARGASGPPSFYTGIDSGGSPSFQDAESFDEAVAGVTQHAGMSQAHGEVIEGEDGHAIVNVQAGSQALYSPDRLGNKLWFSGSINFLYSAPKVKLAQIYSDRGLRSEQHRASSSIRQQPLLAFSLHSVANGRTGRREASWGDHTPGGILHCAPYH